MRSRTNFEKEETRNREGKGGRAFVSALERDILSGYGAVVYLIQGVQGEDGTENDVRIIEYVLACRNDSLK